MKIISTYTSARTAAAVSHRTLFALFLESAKLRFSSPGRLGFTEYLDLALYRSDWYGAETKEAFAGWRLIRKIENSGVVNGTAWRVFGADKLTFSQICQSAGIPVPTIFALYTCGHREVGSIYKARTAQDLVKHLSNQGIAVAFLKPVQGIYGRGAHILELREEDRLTLSVKSSNGVKEMHVGSYQEYLVAIAGRHAQVLCQEVLQPHPALAELTGGGISGVRCGIVKKDDVATCYMAVLKVNNGANVTDNFEHGESGNLLANIDLKTGRVDRVLSNTGLLAIEIQKHPLTRMPILDFHVPFWHEIVSMAMRVVEVFPGIRLAGVDIGITPAGPVVFEINTPGDFDLLQLAARKGVLSIEEVRELCKSLL